MIGNRSVLAGALVSCALVAGLAPGGPPEALAQNKCERKTDLNATKSTYTEQHVLNVGDVPGHQIRIYELRRTFPNDEPNCEGRVRKEMWVRGYSDYINLSGQTSGYAVTIFDNGDKIFSSYSGTSQTELIAGGKKRSIYTATAIYTGGTGQYKGIRGMSRDRIIFDPSARLNIGESTELYWIEE